MRKRTGSVSTGSLMLRLEAVGLAEVDAAGSSRRSRGQTRRKWLWIGPALTRVRWGEATNGELGTGSNHGNQTI